MDLNTKLPELLCPAGDLERLQTALTYGADAVYLGGSALNLRSKAKGFTTDELLTALKLVKKNNAKAYFCLNAFPLETDLYLLEEQLELASQIQPDALIVADPGVISLARKALPRMDLHLSTQANTCNSASIEFWKDFGIKRVNLSRELDMKDIRAISARSRGVELEVFVHGAMCMAISGRCFLSAHLNKRSANLGRCAHPCRYEYAQFNADLEERTRPGRPAWTLNQDSQYSRIFSAEDLCLVKYIPWFLKNRIHSLKIEGRTKSVSYLAIAADVYRTAINDLCQGRFCPEKYLQELSLTSTRSMGTGFFLKNKVFFTDEQKAPGRKKKILARVVSRIGPGRWLVQVKEKWKDSTDIELLLPGLKRPGVKSESYSLESNTGQQITEANSGINAVLCIENELVRNNIFIRSHN